MKLVPITDPILWTPATRFTPEDRESHQETFKELATLLLDLGGACIALPQVGLGLRGFVTRYPNFLIVINPRWVPVAGTTFTSRPESSLSKPGWSAFVRRADNIHAHWETETGAVRESPLHEYESRVFQHACDHLNGVCVFPKPISRAPL